MNKVRSKTKTKTKPKIRTQALTYNKALDNAKVPTKKNVISKQDQGQDLVLDYPQV